ncbi:hypothetical protein SEUCBS140593_009762 [Sporothrix eucalyptigena]|uniref:Uncharacterized protein n=1 Tax=Sporothrix eucalyptigena TaxID=1812306 RepID=A0ABP0CXJ0_9PEZI
MAALTITVTIKATAYVAPSESTPDYGSPSPTDAEHVSVSTPVFHPSNLFGNPGDYEPPTATDDVPSYVPIAFYPTAVLIDYTPIAYPIQSLQHNWGFSGTPTSIPDVVVTVGSNTFTVNPSEVIGGGTTVTRPTFPGDDEGYGGYVATPTSTVLNGMPVQVSGHTVQIDGTDFTLPLQPSTGVVQGTQTVVLGPDGVVVGGETMHVSPVFVSAGVGNGVAGGESGGQGGGSEVVVAGGIVLTLDNSHVIANGQTITYNSASSTVLAVAGDAVTIVPPSNSNGGSSAHVIIHGTTMAAPAPGSTHYEMVGGATFTEVNPSVVAINGHSYTVGPAAASAAPTTVVVGGETVAIGPDGVTVGSSFTFKYPFMTVPTITITPKPKVTAMPASALNGGSKSSPTNGPNMHPNSGTWPQDSGNAATAPGPENATARPLLTPAVTLTAVGLLAAAILLMTI